VSVECEDENDNHAASKQNLSDEKLY